MNLIELVGVLERRGLDMATAETVASMAQSQPIEEAQELLEGMAGPEEVAPYIAARKQAELRKLAVKEDTHGGIVQNGKFQSGVSRNGITVVSQPKKEKKSNAGGGGQVNTADKIDLVKDLEAALNSLSVSRSDRKSCDCMGSKHGLLDMAPNCLNCGRIVCNREGLGPCLFCQQPLLPTQQLDQILRVLETQKSDVVSTMGKKALAAAGISAKSSVDMGRSSAQAQANLDRLLSYQADDAVRTKIIDQAGEADLPSSGVNRWASPEEQAEQLRRQQQQLRRLEHERKARSGQGRKVLSIDVRGNKIFTSVEDEQYASEDEDAELIGTGEAEPVEEATGKAVQYYDSKAFTSQRRFKPAKVKPTSEKPAAVNIIRDPDESLAY